MLRKFDLELSSYINIVSSEVIAEYDAQLNTILDEVMEKIKKYSRTDLIEMPQGATFDHDVGTVSRTRGDYFEKRINNELNTRSTLKLEVCYFNVGSNTKVGLKIRVHLYNIVNAAKNKRNV